MTEYIEQYKVGVIVSCENCTAGTSKGGKALKVCRVNIGDPDHCITVVTAAPNVRDGSRVAVAVAGSKMRNDNGDEIVIQHTSVGGHMSQGVLCDSKMLGWVGGSEGIAQQIPDSIDIGASPPSSKPRVTFDASNATTEQQQPALDVKPLFEKKLTKEEKKKLAEEKRKAKRAAKAASTNATTTTTEDDEEEEN